MWKLDNTALMFVDVQERLAPVMHERERLINNLRAFLTCMQRLAVPIIWTEQLPDKIGPTLPELAAILDGNHPITKSSFGCLGEPVIAAAVEATGRRQVFLCGIECHVCVYQTARQLLSAGYEVDVVADAVSSRTEENRTIGLERMRAAGAGITSVECAVFELMESATHPAFRDVLRVIK